MRVLKLSVLILFLAAYAWGDSSVKLEDRTVSGNRVSVEKVGPAYGMYVTTGKRYMICNKDDDGTPNYYGFEAVDGSWIILKETVSAGADTYQYDSGTSSYSTNWTNRASLSYQNWGDEF